MTDLIAQRSLLLLDTSAGETTRVEIKVGRPYWTQQDLEAACPVAVEGMLLLSTEAHGIDPLNAIQNAILFVDTYLAGNLQGQLLWPDGQPYDIAGAGASPAAQISDELNDILGRLDQTIQRAKDHWPDAEFKAYRRAVGRVMGQIVLDVLNPLYEHHPEVVPPD